MAQYLKYGLTLITFISLSAIAAPTALECQTSATLNENAGDLLKIVNEVEGNCKTEPNLDGLCAVVSSLREESEESEQSYVYQTKILSAACVKDSDNEDQVKKKVQSFWKKNESKLTCDSPDFNVPNGSIIKFAIARRFEDFIDDVTETWSVDLNKVDPSDNRTVLDYVKSEQEKHKGTPIEAILKRYYKKLKDSGAKHKAEL